MKICIKCKINKNEVMFNKHSSYKDGLRSTCKECVSQSRKVINNKPLKNGNKKCKKCMINKNVKFFSKDKTNQILQDYKLIVKNVAKLKQINGEVHLMVF